MPLSTIEEFSPIIDSYTIDEYDFSGPHAKLRATLTFIDRSVLFVRMVVLESETLKYAYHWQDCNGTLRSRWDNAPHWEEIATFPHHRHVGQPGGETAVLEWETGGDLRDVLPAIRHELLKEDADKHTGS